MSGSLAIALLLLATHPVQCDINGPVVFALTVLDV